MDRTRSHPQPPAHLDRGEDKVGEEVVPQVLDVHALGAALQRLLPRRLKVLVLPHVRAVGVHAVPLLLQPHEHGARIQAAAATEGGERRQAGPWDSPDDNRAAHL